ncbi:hypothetical protein ACFXPT_39540 [Streptomyces goshikiensis]|uniref:hypothetical protein n=1 Tax=Streptomyces goshikiensis TaxID=1942 RepID=UPI00369B53B2
MLSVINVLINGNIDVPSLSEGYQIGDDAGRRPEVGWTSTAPDRQIEIWSAAMGQTSNGQSVELNANMRGDIYQVIDTIPGDHMFWSLFHKGREGVDTMAVDIGPESDLNSTYPRGGQKVISDSSANWVQYSGVYVVPCNQMRTYFRLRSVSSTGPDLSYGNLVSHVFFGKFDL